MRLGVPLIPTAGLEQDPEGVRKTCWEPFSLTERPLPSFGPRALAPEQEALALFLQVIHHR